MRRKTYNVEFRQPVTVASVRDFLIKRADGPAQGTFDDELVIHTADRDMYDVDPWGTVYFVVDYKVNPQLKVSGAQKISSMRLTGHCSSRLVREMQKELGKN